MDHPILPQKTFWGVWANLIIGGILSRLRRWDNTNPCTKLRYFYGHLEKLSPVKRDTQGLARFH